MVSYRMKRFTYGYIDETGGEMLRVGKTRTGDWQIQYRRRFGVNPRNIGTSWATKKRAMGELMSIRHKTPNQLLALSREVT